MRPLGLVGCWTAAMIAAAFGFAAPAAQAATVSAVLGPPPNQNVDQGLVLEVDASGDGGQANAIAVALVGVEGDLARFRVTDFSGGLSAASGCSGGGGVVECLVPNPHPGVCETVNLTCSGGLGFQLVAELGEGSDGLAAGNIGASPDGVLETLVLGRRRRGHDRHRPEP